MMTETTAEVLLHGRRGLAACLPRLEAFVASRGPLPLSRHPAWATALADGLGHEPYILEATAGGRTTGVLPLCHVRGMLFGRFLVSLPYLNHGGVLADDPPTAARLIDRAAVLARRLDVRYLELRHTGAAVEHPALGREVRAKVHMRLALPPAPGALWEALDPKVRNQVRKGRKAGLEIAWGGEEFLPGFHDVFSRNMRDLGTPVFGQGLFRAILRHFPGRAELCLVRQGGRPVAGALLLHGWGVTEVPSASSLRSHNHTNANMLMYWELLERSVGRGQGTFDFGRSTPDGGTFRFKKQWGALPEPAVWQYHLIRGDIGDVRPENPKYRRLTRIWSHLPLSLTRLAGPAIVRGIP